MIAYYSLELLAGPLNRMMPRVIALPWIELVYLINNRLTICFLLDFDFNSFCNVEVEEKLIKENYDIKNYNCLRKQ